MRIGGSMPRYNIEQHKSYCAKWQTSGLSKQSFCTRENISESALHKWLKIYNSSSSEVESKETGLKFLPIEKTNEFKAELTRIEILLPNGVLIKAEVNSVAKTIRELLQ